MAAALSSRRDALTARARRRARILPDRLLATFGYELLRKHYYSPVPDLPNLPPDIWNRRSDLTGVQLEVAAGLRLMREELAPFLAEFDPAPAPTGDRRRFHFGNTFFESVDAELLYAMVRRFRPRRVLELGSGMSTLIIAEARERNAVPGSTHVVCDPFARTDLPLGELAEVRPIGAADVPPRLVEELRAGDLLFVDTTHTVKIGGDVNHIVLDILPRLARGVFIHIHDIFLPWEYPREFLTERRFFWAEQYLVQAFLAFNREFEVLCAAHALTREFPDAVRELVPSMTAETGPASFWLRRRD